MNKTVEEKYCVCVFVCVCVCVCWIIHVWAAGSSSDTQSNLL